MVDLSDADILPRLPIKLDTETYPVVLLILHIIAPNNSEIASVGQESLIALFNNVHA